MWIFKEGWVFLILGFMEELIFGLVKVELNQKGCKGRIWLRKENE